jgi:glutamine amidotransferase
MGNVASIVNAFKKIGANVAVSMDSSDLLRADRLILPGVGAFDAGMSNLERRGYRQVLHEQVVERRVPILGICLGMQLFTQRSEEGARAGLGWLDAETIRFRFDADHGLLKIPHMGWNYVQLEKRSTLFPETAERQRFYFVHSYYVSCRQHEDVLTTTQYGTTFASAVCRGNIAGVQFHPEKSHRFGFAVLRNFLAWAPEIR